VNPISRKEGRAQAVLRHYEGMKKLAEELDTYTPPPPPVAAFFS